jgi:hypothetical protein
VRAVFLLVVGVAHAVPSPSPAPCPTAELETELSHAEMKTAAVQKEMASFTRLGAGTAPACQVELFNRYWQFYGRVQSELAEKMQTSEQQKKRLERELKSVGWAYFESEAGGYIKESGDWLPKKAGSSLPPDWRRYLTLRIGDVRAGFSEDAGLTIGWTDLRKRIRSWEDFLAAYPAFAHADEVRESNKMYLAVLLAGMDNSPTLDGEGHFVPEVKTELDAYLADKKARDKKLVGRYVKLIEGGKADQASEYLKKQGLTSMMGQEPPRY